MTWLNWVAVAAALGVAAPPAVARAEPESQNVDQRLEFLEERIARQRTHAEIWWEGWLSFYAFGAVVQAVRAPLQKDPATRADMWIGLTKTMGGLAVLVANPYAGIRGIEPSPRQERYGDAGARLERAEQILQHNAARTNAFGPWYEHLINLAVNGLGAVVVGVGYDGWQQGLTSAAIGFGVGEVEIFTRPWEADDDVDAYQRRFSIQLTAGPSHQGGSLQLVF